MPLRRDDLDFHELDGEAVLYDARCGAVHRFNPGTLAIWDACDGRHSRAGIAGMLTERSSFDSDHALAHVERTMAEFEARGLLQGKRVETAVAAEGGKRLEPRRTTQKALGSSRREVLRTTGKVVLAAPLISTFFAASAYASAPASGPGGCKNPGYSCTTTSDCCVANPNGQCQASKCCIKFGKSGCYLHTDCCGYPDDVCVSGTCQ